MEKILDSEFSKNVFHFKTLKKYFSTPEVCYF